jgi:hypothetical protein
MSRRLIVRPEAELEMADAFDWYEERVPGLGAEFLLCFKQAMIPLCLPTITCPGAASPHQVST